MTELLNVSAELQITLVAGYLAYMIATIGRNVDHPPQHMAMQVLAFGLVARLAVLLLIWFAAMLSIPLPETEIGSFVLNGGMVVAIGVGMATWWRKRGNEKWSDLMGQANVYRDDHEASVLASMMREARREWKLVHIHLEDGTVLEADYYDLDPDHYPMNAITLNSDGIALYITKRIDPKGKEEVFELPFANGDVMITYIPMVRIARFSVVWR